MTGIIILLVLMLCSLITAFAARFGWRRGKTKKHKILGAFVGFMLTMGGVLSYWIIEYVYLQITVTKLCEAEGGIKIYITPEEWRKMVGEKGWGKLTTYSKYSGQKEIEEHYRMFNGIKYRSSSKMNPRILMYTHNYKEKINKFTHEYKTIFFDIKSNQILLETTEFHVASGNWASGGSYKEWINNVKSCSNRDFGLNQLLKKYSNHKTRERK